MSMTDCEHVLREIELYIDRELDATETQHIQEHLAECGGCRQAQARQLALRSALRDPELYAHPSADFSKPSTKSSA